ncbi:MAG: PP0621 family protein [Betaproteobacteria bacterium]
MIGRLLFWVLLAFVAWWLLRPRRKAPPAASTPPAPPPVPVEAMVDCARCGLHLPASEALLDAQGRGYCSSAHREAGPHGGQ